MTYTLKVSAEALMLIIEALRQVTGFEKLRVDCEHLADDLHMAITIINENNGMHSEETNETN